MEEKSKSKTIYQILGLGITIVFIIGGYFVYQYWYEGTPEYSLSQLQTALKKDSSTIALNYVDENLIFNNFWPRFSANLQSKGSQYGVLGMVLTSSLITNEKDAVHNALDNDLYTIIKNGETGKNQTAEYFYLADIFSQINVLNSPSFSIDKNTASLAVQSRPNFTTPSLPEVNFTIVFTRQSNRQWKITDIQGLETATLNNFNSQ
jgi:hypothetical protein